MAIVSRTRLLVLAVLVCVAPLLCAQKAAKPAPVTLTTEQQVQFLLSATEVSARRVGEGVTNSRRATFTDGKVTHDIHIQTVDDFRPVFETPKGVELNFRDSYRYNIAAYRLAALLGLNNVPVSVGRTYNNRPASYTWWIDDVIMDEERRVKARTTGPDPQRYVSFLHIRLVFDELIQNVDRNAGNIQFTSDWTMWLIDHTRAFRLGKTLRNPQLLERVEAGLFARMRALTDASVKEAVGDSLTDSEVEALIARAKVIVELFDRKIAEQGEARVLYVKR